MKSGFRNSILLIITAFIWGVAFVFQSKGGDAIGPYSFCSLRNVIAFFVLIPVISLFDKLGFSQGKPKTSADKKQLWIGGVCCGCMLAIATIFQQLGMYFGTSAGKAGFLTACYIVIVPILGLFLKRRCGWNVWIAVVITLAGLYLLCMSGSMRMQKGDVFVLICSFLYALHIMIIDHFVQNCDPVRMSRIQFLTAAVVSAVPMFFVEIGHTSVSVHAWLDLFTTWDAWIPLLYAGVLSSGVAYTLQVVGQKGVNPTVASLLMSLESVFSVLAGWLLLHEVLGSKEVWGCVLIFAALVFAQVPLQKISGKKCDE